MAVLQADGFISHAIDASAFWVAAIRSIGAHQPAPPDTPRPKDRNIVKALAPDQAVVPVVVPEILIRLPSLLRLRVIVAARLPLRERIGGNHDSALVQTQRDIALQPDGVAKVLPSWKMN